MHFNDKDAVDCAQQFCLRTDEIITILKVLRSDQENCGRWRSVYEGKYIRMLPCVAGFFYVGISWLKTGAFMDWWDHSDYLVRETYPGFLTTQYRKSKIPAWEGEWQLGGIQVIVFLSLKCLPVHSLSHAAAGIPKQNTLRWLWAAQGSAKQLRLFSGALRVTLPGPLHLQSRGQ